MAFESFIMVDKVAQYNDAKATPIRSSNGFVTQNFNLDDSYVRLYKDPSKDVNTLDGVNEEDTNLPYIRDWLHCDVVDKITTPSVLVKAISFSIYTNSLPSILFTGDAGEEDFQIVLDGGQRILTTENVNKIKINGRSSNKLYPNQINEVLVSFSEPQLVPKLYSKFIGYIGRYYTLNEDIYNSTSIDLFNNESMSNPISSDQDSIGSYYLFNNGIEGTDLINGTTPIVIAGAKSFINKQLLY